MEAGIFTWMVASQHPLRIGRTQSLGWLLRNILFALVVLKAMDGCFATSSSHWSYSKPWMVASQHPLRIGRTQSGLFPLVTSSSQLPYSKPFKNISCADVFAFLHLSAKSSELVSRLCTKKPALFVRAL
jgi:hypothetical protein